MNVEHILLQTKITFTAIRLEIYCFTDVSLLSKVLTFQTFV